LVERLGALVELDLDVVEALDPVAQRLLQR
jgi:hypothetical protein